MQFRLHLIVSRQFIDIFFNIHRKDCFPALDEGFQETFHTQTKNCFNRNIKKKKKLLRKLFHKKYGFQKGPQN